MRFKRFSAGGYGCLKNWQSPDIVSNLVVFFGCNESGKSTLFNLLTTILYGWDPPSNKRNLYMPWDEPAAACSAVLETGDFKELEVFRVLRSKPESSVIVEGKSINLGNDALMQLAFLPRIVYREVFALTNEQLRFPEKKAWDKLQDQLLGGQYGSFLRPASTVIKELEDDAARLWRPDKRGKPKSKQLKERIRILNKEKSEAQENENALRRVEAELEEKNLEIKELVSQKASIILNLDRAERLIPVYKKLKRIEELMNKVKDAAVLEELPPDPGKDLIEMDEQVNHWRDKKQDLLEELKGLELDRDSLNPEDKKICTHAEQIKTLSKSYSQLEIDLQHRLDLESEIESFKVRIHERARDLLQGGWKEEHAAAVEIIDEAELKAAIESFKKAETEFLEQRARAEGLKARAGGGRRYGSLPVLSLLFLLLSITGLFISENSLLGFASVLLGFLSLVLFLVWWLLKGDRVSDTELAGAGRQLKDLENLLQQKRDAVKDALQGLPLAASWLDWPGESLLLEISRLKEHLRSKSERIGRKEKIEGRIKEKEAFAAQLLQSCGILYSKGLLDTINQLELRLSAAEKALAVHTEACGRIKEVNKELEAVEEKINDIERKKNDLLQNLNKIDGQDLDEKINNLAALRKQYHRAAALEEDLNREYPDLENLLKEIDSIEQNEGENWFLSEEKKAWLKAELGQIEEQLNQINKDTGLLRKELEYRQDKSRLDDIEGEIKQIQSDYQKTYQERDRLLLLKNIIVEADKRFRDEHQPEILSLAGNYLKTITGGRYDRLILKDLNEPGLLVRGDYYNNPIDVTQLSRGTLQQVYLALRLALIDHLDSAGERLPVFLDEVLVHWDDERLSCGLDLLDQIAGTRQVFLFTCHEWIVEKLENNKQIQIVSLP